MKAVRVTARISDGETKQYLNTEKYIVTVKDPDNYEELFDVLFEEYPEDFPSKDPGVDGTIITCSEDLINLIGAAIEHKILDYKEVKIVGLSPNKVKCTFESTFNEKGYLINWPIGFFGDHELLLGGNE